MKHSIATAILFLAVGLPSVSFAQVYGGDDDPYSQNPYASNFTVPDPGANQPSNTTGPADASAANAAPANPQQPDSGKAQQTASGSANQPTAKPAQP